MGACRYFRSLVFDRVNLFFHDRIISVADSSGKLQLRGEKPAHSIEFQFGISRRGIGSRWQKRNPYPGNRRLGQTLKP